MVHGLAMQSSGAFRLASAVGAGTTVTLWLPVALEAPVAATATEAVPPSAPRHASLLLVDDETLVRTSTAELLQELGYAVTEAGSAAEALDLVRTGLVPELVVTDHMMPGMTGAELAVEVRRRRPGLPLLLVSGYSDLASIAADIPRLEKPFRQRDLAMSIAGVLG